MVWSVIGWLLLGLLVLLMLALLLPAVITIQLGVHGGLQVWGRVLFVRLRLFPFTFGTGKTKKARKKKQTSKEASAAAEKDKPAKSFGQKFALMKRMINASVAAGKVYIRHMRVRDVQLVAPIHAGDASETALMCGRVQAVVGTLRAVLDGRLKVRFSRLQVIPDYAGQMQQEWYFACKVYFNPVIMFKMAYVFLKLFLRKQPYSKAAYKRAIAQKRAARVADDSAGHAA